MSTYLSPIVLCRHYTSICDCVFRHYLVSILSNLICFKTQLKVMSIHATQNECTNLYISRAWNIAFVWHDEVICLFSYNVFMRSYFRVSFLLYLSFDDLHMYMSFFRMYVLLRETFAFRLICFLHKYLEFKKCCCQSVLYVLTVCYYTIYHRGVTIVSNDGVMYRHAGWIFWHSRQYSKVTGYNTNNLHGLLTHQGLCLCFVSCDMCVLLNTKSCTDTLLWEYRRTAC